ncbi:MAG: glycosyltransferase family 1 protein [Desulfuromonadales bacterium]|nr:MAG: glycosyltransferase family 1 protein [Desulfuromonadales bacterium]
MKIALVTACFLPNAGGGEYVVHYLANEWAKHGHEVCVFNFFTDKVTHPEALYNVKKYTIMRGATRFGYHRFPWLQVSVRSLNKLINEFDPDFISGHFSIPVAFYLSKLNPKRRWSITSHGADVVIDFVDSQRDKQKCDTRLLADMNQAAAVISISQNAQYSLESLGIEKSRIRYIPNGVDILKFAKPVATDYRAKYGLGAYTKFVVTIARNSKQKNLELGIKAFKIIAEKNPDIHYLMVGYETGSFQTLVDIYGLTGRVTLLDAVFGDELIWLFQNASVFLSTSVWEFCPLVILEAMAAGLPQVATNVPGTMDIVVHGETGLLVSLNNEIQMAAAVLKIIDDPEYHAQLRSNNLMKAQHYSWDSISRKYLELVQSKPVNL